MNPKEAEEILKSKFKQHFKDIDGWIKSKLTIKQIIEEIRKKGYSFDNSHISRCIGAYRTNILSKIKKKLFISKKEIVLQGNIRKDKQTFSINFHLSPLYKIIEAREIRVGLELSEDRKNIRILPLEFGRKILKTSGGMKILLTEKSGIQAKSKINLILNPKLFGFDISESIYDSDARKLFLQSLKKGFEIDSQRSTPNNHKGDLSLFFAKKHILIEITRAKSYKSSYFKIGQCFIQKLSWPKSIQFLICKKSLLSTDSLKALKKLGIKIICTKFNKGWEKEIIKEIKNGL